MCLEQLINCLSEYFLCVVSYKNRGKKKFRNYIWARLETLWCKSHNVYSSRHLSKLKLRQTQLHLLCCFAKPYNFASCCSMFWAITCTINTSLANSNYYNLNDSPAIQFLPQTPLNFIHNSHNITQINTFTDTSGRLYSVHSTLFLLGGGGVPRVQNFSLENGYANLNFPCFSSVLPNEEILRETKSPSIRDESGRISRLSHFAVFLISSRQILLDSTLRI
jgi:hypothetical protein